MDEFNRASNAALVSQNKHNAYYLVQNQLQKIVIRVEIPTSQIAPYWAKRYKFCIKQDKQDYFNIYTSFFFTDPTYTSYLLLLEGQNAQKVEEIDIFK